jgi:hypothetical protein
VSSLGNLQACYVNITLETWGVAREWVSIKLRRARTMVLRSSLSNRSKVWVRHRLFGREPFLAMVSLASLQFDSSGPYLMVVSEQLVKEVNGIVANKSLIVRIDK